MEKKTNKDNLPGAIFMAFGRRKFKSNWSVFFNLLCFLNKKYCNVWYVHVYDFTHISAALLFSMRINAIVYIYKTRFEKKIGKKFFDLLRSLQAINTRKKSEMEDSATKFYGILDRICIRLNYVIRIFR